MWIVLCQMGVGAVLVDERGTVVAKVYQSGAVRMCCYIQASPMYSFGSVVPLTRIYPTACPQVYLAVGYMRVSSMPPGVSSSLACIHKFSTLISSTHTDCESMQ